ncbi:MlaC/ttg2D family ABC transporter substrate-binding protein [Rhodocista pekingensis]|uniref:Phospholipid-binding protein MlaC n=1 Tax=Rhodocista pekingensis TaxID=201185 RepID=A0ABW2KW38_9PROT
MNNNTPPVQMNRSLVLRTVFVSALAAATVLTGTLTTAALRPAVAQAQAQGAGDFVESLGDRAIAVLADPKVTDAQAVEEFRRLLNENFDVTTIGRFVLGRYWNTASEAQRQEYMKLFERMIVEVYAQRFNQYAGETFEVTGSRADGTKDAIVSSQVLRPNGPPVKVDWRVRARDGGYRIVDVVVEGVSMSVTQRSEFASVIESNGGNIDALLDALRKRAQTAAR